MLRKISASNNESKEQYNFSLVKVSRKDLSTISLAKFVEAYQTLDGEMKILGSNEADDFCYVFCETELGLVRVKVKSETEGERVCLDIEYLDGLPGSDGNDIFLTKK